MSGLVDPSQQRTRGQVWLRRAAVALAMVALVGLLVWMGLHISGGAKGPKHQIAKIALLPDTPPPPPPPPPPDKPKVEPKNEMKQQVDKPKQQAPQAPEPLKMEGQAGEGPSPFAAGEVKNDYIGGDIGNGSRFAAYVGRVAQMLQEALAKRNMKVPNARVFLWLQPDGSIQRYEVKGASGDAERQLRVAMGELGRLPEAPPLDMPMPVGLEISGR